MKNRTCLILALSCLNLMALAQTVTDVDDNIYNTIQIGTQTWMQENLRTTHFNDGTAIPTTSSPIYNDSTSVYQWAYDLDSTYINDYGLLYTWYVVINDKNACPSGWHIPDNAEWDTLRNFLGGEMVAGSKMKETGTTRWTVTDSTVDNSSGFTGVGSGFRGNPTGFNGLNASGSFWSCTPVGTIDNFPRGYLYRLHAGNSTFTQSVAVANVGTAIRCIKDLPTNTSSPSMNRNLKVFPNPATESISVSIEEVGKYELVIYNTVGAIVFQEQLTDQINHLNIAQLPRGSYLIKVVGEDYVGIQKLIKQ